MNEKIGPHNHFQNFLLNTYINAFALMPIPPCAATTIALKLFHQSPIPSSIGHTFNHFFGFITHFYPFSPTIIHFFFLIVKQKMQLLKNFFPSERFF